MKKETRKVDVFITDDGMTFPTEAQASYHEQSRVDYEIEKSLTKMELQVPLLGSDTLDETWILVGNEVQRDYLVRKYVDKRNYHYVNGSNEGKLELGDWVAVRYETDSYGDRGKDGLLTLAFLIEKMQEFIEAVNDATVNGKY